MVIEENSRLINLQHKYNPTMPEVVEEMKKIWDISFPVAAMSILNYLKNMTSVVFMGRLGSLELAGGALAVGFTNITGYSVLSGLATGMEPLCGQAIGSKNPSLASSTLKRTIFLLLLASLPISLLWLNLQPLMLILRQQQDITRVASLYCSFSLPDLLANSFLHPLRIYLRCKGTTWPLMWCTLVSVLLHLPITAFFTFYVSLGVAGVAISSFLTNFISLSLLLCYIYLEDNKNNNNNDKTSSSLCLKTPLMLSGSRDSSCDDEVWSTLVKFAVPSCIAVCLEWWWYEFMTVLAGYLPEPTVALAAAAIVIQTTSLLYTIPTALSAAVSTRVSNELGAGRPEKARTAAVVAVGAAVAVSVLGLVGTTVGRKAWGRVFTADGVVLELTAAVLPVIGACELANCPQTTSCGILRGSARPRVGAKINFYAFYVVGAPVAVVLAFVWGLGFMGLCYGLLGAQLACAVSILTVVYKTDWNKESSKAHDLVGKNVISPDTDQIIVKCEEGLH
ncbi:hypothetical protein EUTSA_v10004047mg [Eutrema salsugineum]|uniref:Protein DETOXIFICATION n=1 Tax=Eutrema salsugineum TaxID=72664 RepID=V4KY83_EUTSA|nr:protein DETOXIFICATION 55 [Eutrema salsugineum]ESQ32378.1 hypothetical protein EUTSA_v10004047mg [Eutrema salsugineum]